MQLSFKRSTRAKRLSNGSHARLAELQEGEEGVLERLDLPDDMAGRLMELGFIPGTTVKAARSAPGGDPRIFQVDGSEVALRRETAALLILKM